MTNPKISEKEMVEWFDKMIVNSMFNLSKFPKRDKAILKAIRAAIAKEGRLIDGAISRADDEEYSKGEK